MEAVKEADFEIFEHMRGELLRQKNVLNMIPSENYVSPAVLEACGSSDFSFDIFCLGFLNI